MTKAATPWWITALIIVLASGAATIIATVIISIIRVRKIISGGRHELLDSGETLVITETDTAPFSWMKYIVLSKEDYESGYSQILTHEKAHIALRHSWDILFVDMITALQWFNPAIWMLKADLRAIHEFEADDAVLRSGANVKEYQYLLIRKAVSKSGYSVANSFNHSTLKARITMMLNKKSSRLSAWKALYVIPLVGISLVATAETKVDYQYEGQQNETAASTLIDKDSKKIFKEKNMMEGHFIINEDVKSITMVYYDHEGNEMRATHIGLDLNQDLYFVNGNMATPKSFELRMEEEDAVVLNAYMKNGMKVRGAVLPNNNYVTGTWDVNKPFDQQETIYHMDGKEYQVREGKYVEIETSQKIVEKKEPVPFQHAAQVPGFNGGDANEFSKWVSQNLTYPEKCRQSKIQGRVTLQFTITEEGRVTDVKVLRGVNEELDKEAVRVVSASPLWTPGKNDKGEVIPISFVFPVIFKL